MAIFRGIVGIIIGVALAYLVGIILDYFHLYQGADYTRVYPFLTALGGGIAAIVAMLIRGTVGTARVVLDRAERSRAARTVAHPETASASRVTTPLGSRPGSAAGGSGGITPSSSTTPGGSELKISESRDIPGMPSFEVKKSPEGGSGSRP